MRRSSSSYVMESLDEALRLEIKTDPETVQKQARWCGISEGLRVLDAGCGPGRVTSILHELTRPTGFILGVDYSRERILHARQHYGTRPGIAFAVHDLRDPMENMEPFDLIWVRFVLEYNRVESVAIVENLNACLRPGGLLCLLDLDHNCLNHYELPPPMEQILFDLMALMEKGYDFDPYCGRKLYSYLYDLGYEDIQLDLMAHHLLYGEIKDADIFNWVKKVEVSTTKAQGLFADYPGGREAFFGEFMRFFRDPRRFTYTPLILCKGKKPKGANRLRAQSLSDPSSAARSQ